MIIGDNLWCIKTFGEKFLSEANEIELPDFEGCNLNVEKQLEYVREGEYGLIFFTRHNHPENICEILVARRNNKLIRLSRGKELDQADCPQC